MVITGYIYAMIMIPTDRHNFIDQPWATAKRARHETVNRVFKHYKILQEVYHHNIQKHGDAFNSIVNIVQSHDDTDLGW